MAQEFLQPRSNQWEGTIRQLPDKWIADSWVEVYGFWKEGRTVAGRTDRWIDGKFSSPINSKDGHAADDCVDPREQRILEFVVLIIYSEKPKHVTKVVGNTIFGSLSEEYKVNWGQVIHEVVHRLVSHLEKGKSSPINPYLFHLYSRNECLNKMFEISLETVAHPEEVESKRGSLSPREWFQVVGTSSSGRLKQTYESLEGSLKIQNLDWRSMATFKGNPFPRIFNDLEQLQFQYFNLETITTRASKLLSDCKVRNIVEELKKLQEKNTKSLEKEVADLKVELALRKDEVNELKVRAGCLEWIREVVGIPGDVLNKACLFDEDIKTEREVFATKFVKVLVTFTQKMETTLMDI